MSVLGGMMKMISGFIISISLICGGNVYGCKHHGNIMVAS